MKKILLVLLIFIGLFVSTTHKNSNALIDIPYNKDYYNYMDSEVFPINFTSSSEAFLSIQKITSKIKSKKEISSIKNTFDRFESEVLKSGNRSLYLEINNHKLCFVGRGHRPKTDEDGISSIMIYHELEHCYVRSRYDGGNVEYYFKNKNPININLKKEIGKIDYSNFLLMYSKYIDESYSDLSIAIYYYGKDKNFDVFNRIISYRNRGLCELGDLEHWSVPFLEDAMIKITDEIIDNKDIGNHRSVAKEIISSLSLSKYGPIEFNQIVKTVKDKKTRICNNYD